MNLFTIFGAAAVDPRFAILLFNDPQAAVNVLGLKLSQEEMDFLTNTVQGEHRDEIKQHLFAVAGGVCHHPPCPLITVSALCQ